MSNQQCQTVQITQKRTNLMSSTSRALHSPAKQQKEGYGQEDEKGDVDGQPRIAGGEGQGYHYREGQTQHQKSRLQCAPCGSLRLDPRKRLLIWRKFKEQDKRLLKLWESRPIVRTFTPGAKAPRRTAFADEISSGAADGSSAIEESRAEPSRGGSLGVGERRVDPKRA